MSFGSFYFTAMLKFDDAYDFGIATYKHMIRTMLGKPGALGSHDYALLAQCVKFAADGDYLEIGTAFGYSAIMAALTKKEFNLSGNVVCIDPLNGTHDGFEFDPDSPGVPITPETVMENAKRMGVELEIVREKSEPFPIKNRRFAITFIDGWHADGQPLRDWEAVKEVTDKVVMFHDYDDRNPDVVNACKMATFHKNWMPLHISGNTFVVVNNRL